jgi:hypothetical protein
MVEKLRWPSGQDIGRFSLSKNAPLWFFTFSIGDALVFLATWPVCKPLTPSLCMFEINVYYELSVTFSPSHIGGLSLIPHQKPTLPFFPHLTRSTFTPNLVTLFNLQPTNTLYSV